MPFQRDVYRGVIIMPEGLTDAENRKDLLTTRIRMTYSTNP